VTFGIRYWVAVREFYGAASLQIEAAVDTGFGLKLYSQDAGLKPAATKPCGTPMKTAFSVAWETSTLLPVGIVPCTIAGRVACLQTVLAGRNATPERGHDMLGGYANWMGQPVILRVVAGNMRVPLRGRLVSETEDVVRLRIADSWDVDIFKSMVAAIEQDTPVYVVH